MNKKLMAVAVAGALAMPAVAFAQVSTVQIYGYFNVEYGLHVKQPNTAANLSRHNADALNSANSRIGFKGEEKLGGGLSAWFQCETLVTTFSIVSTVTGWCGRNTAIGLKGDFGNVFIGSWDTPIKIASGKTRIINETGWLGAQHLILTGPIFSFSNRETNSVNYATPTFGGFSANAQYTTVQAALDAASATTAKGRRLGLSADYSQGPLLVAAGWARHSDNRTAAATLGRRDTAWLIGATYTMAPFKAGLTYTRNKNEPTATTDRKRNAWNLGIDYQITGPGSIRFGYTHAGNNSGSAAVAATEGGAKQWQIGYNHAFSKRTTGGLAYVRLDNNSTGTYNLTGLAAGAANVRPGNDADAFMMSLIHTF